MTRKTASQVYNPSILSSTVSQQVYLYCRAQLPSRSFPAALLPEDTVLPLYLLLVGILLDSG